MAGCSMGRAGKRCPLVKAARQGGEGRSAAHRGRNNVGRTADARAGVVAVLATIARRRRAMRRRWSRLEVVMPSPPVPQGSAQNRSHGSRVTFSLRLSGRPRDLSTLSPFGPWREEAGHVGVGVLAGHDEFEGLRIVAGEVPASKPVDDAAKEGFSACAIVRIRPWPKGRTGKPGLIAASGRRLARLVVEVGALSGRCCVR